MKLKTRRKNNMLYLDIGLYIALIYMPKIWQLYKKKLNIKTLDIALDLAIITGLSSSLHHSKEYLMSTLIVYAIFLACYSTFLIIISKRKEKEITKENET